MLEIAQRIIEQQEAEFDPSEFRDRYEDAVRDLVERKTRGEKLVRSTEPAEEGKVVDLMEALRRSLKDGRASRERTGRFRETHGRHAKLKSRRSSRKQAA